MVGWRLAGPVLGVAVMAAAGIALAGCSATEGSSPGREEAGGETVSLPDTQPGIAGVITEIERAPDGETPVPERILVEENPDRGKPESCSESPSRGCDKLYLDITDQTSIFRRAESYDENFAQATSGDLEIGQRVRAWHGDVVMRSYPGQTDARVIVIDDVDAAFDRTADSGSQR